MKSQRTFLMLSFNHSMQSIFYTIGAINYVGPIPYPSAHNQ